MSPEPASSPAFVLREARPGDRPRVLKLARWLDSINLPTGAADLAAMIARSRRSFAGRVRDHAAAAYVFVAEDRRRRRLAGASMIIAKHGTPESPHYYLEMVSDQRYSKTLDRMFNHTYLHLRHSMDGPTEIGGLIVDPRRRRHPEHLGRQLSYVRFLYMAAHRGRFGSEVIAEMKPPLTPRGESRFWQCYGARVTGLTFHEADRLSTRDKEFIPALFPDVPIYTCMLPVEVQEELGQVGPETVGAVHLLQKIGLRFLNQIDPFDAGPYYGAPLDEVRLVREARRVRLIVERAEESPEDSRDLLIGVERRGFLAFAARGRIAPGTVALPARLFRDLGLGEGVAAVTVPFS